MRAWFDWIVSAEEGVTAIEYAVIGGIMALAVVAAMGILTPGLETTFGMIAAALAG